jgi:hypothetical protein
MASTALRCAFLALAAMHVGGAMELPAEMPSEGAAAEITGTGGNVTAFPEAMFGVWMPKKGVPIKTILGPLSYSFITQHLGAFSALRDKRTKDVWFTMLIGQVFHVSGNQMQYCFGEEAVFEQSPFSVNSTSDKDVTFCWRTGGRGMPTHTKGCTGCDCASIQITLTDANTLHFQFWQSKPVPHVDMTLVRYKAEPSFAKAIITTMPSPYTQCRMRDHRTTNVPGEPDLQTHRTAAPLTAGCALSGSLLAKRDPAVARLVADAMALGDSKSANQCHQLNGLNHQLDNVPISPKMHVPDVKLQYKVPQTPCNPCDVSYSVSAKINEDEYISVGFKGQSWEDQRIWSDSSFRTLIHQKMLGLATLVCASTRLITSLLTELRLAMRPPLAVVFER